MAGGFPDMPSRKIPYDVDGSVVATRWPNGGTPKEKWLEWPDAYKKDLNDIDESRIEWSPYGDFWLNQSVDANGGYFCETVIVFPEHRDVYGWYISGWPANIYSLNQLFTIEVSADSTNGLDGTWTQLASFQPNQYGDQRFVGWYYQPRPGEHRTRLSTTDQPGIRAFRVLTGWISGFQSGSQWRSCHIWGAISAGQTPDRLLFIDNDTGLEFTKPLDWGDTPRGLTQDHDIKIKNNSSTLDAANTTLSFSAEYETSDTWHTIKETGGSFDTTLLIASILAGATYPAGGNVITVRNAVPVDAVVFLYEARLEASAPTWS